jgi:hypothetical protein
MLQMCLKWLNRRNGWNRHDNVHKLRYEIRSNWYCNKDGGRKVNTTIMALQWEIRFGSRAQT